MGFGKRHRGGSFEGHKDIIFEAALTADNQHFLTGSNDKTIKIWSFAQRRANRVVDFASSISSMVETGDYLALAVGKEIKLWSLREDRELAVLQGHSNQINEIVVTSDLQFLLSAADDCSIKLWDLKSREELHSFTGHPD